MAAGSHGSDREPVRARFAVPTVPSHPRRRVHDAIRNATRAPLAVVSAPAGAGKTTAVASFVRESDTDHAWCRVGATGATAAALLSDIEHVLAGQLTDLSGGWTTVDKAVSDLSRAGPRGRLVLVVDDVHHLLGSSGEQALDELVAERPTWLHVVAISREPVAGLGIATRRVTGEVVEVPADVLRWRHWEVDELFRDFYREPLRPEDAARLTHRTEGWSAGLQLFHLATRQLPLADRRELIDELHTRPGLVRDYLASNVLAQLPAALLAFLVDTCVLGRLEPSLCDELRDAPDSVGHLDELRERQLFVIPQEDGHGYRYHEVLRAHLHHRLVERDGEANARARHHRAARILEDAGHRPDALQAYARAEAWDDVRRVLGTGGPVLAAGMSLVALDELPPALFGDDPWLHLARARALAGDGLLVEALAAYGLAQDAFGTSPQSRVVRTARRVLRCWTSTTHTPAESPLEHLRAATMADPASVVDHLAGDDSVAARLVAGAAALLAGRPTEAIACARAVSARAGPEVLELALAEVLEQVAISLAGGNVDRRRLEAVATTLEHLGLTAVVRVIRAALACMRGARPEPLTALADSRRTRGDAWGAAMIDLVVSITVARSGRQSRALADRAAGAFEELGAPVLAGWAGMAAGAAATSDPDADGLVDEFRRVPDFVDAALAGIDRDGAPSASSPWRVRLHGGLSIAIGTRRLALDDLRPHARQGLALLVLDLGRPVHEDRLSAALWPGADQAVAKRRLQVLISSLRGALEAGGLDRGDLARHGCAYVLRPPDGTMTDAVRASACLEAADAARRNGDDDAEAIQLRTAVGIIREPLLPTLHDADWLDDERDRSQLRLAVATRRLAEIDVANGDFDGAIHWAMASIDADPYSEAAARLLAMARNRATLSGGTRTSNALR